MKNKCVSCGKITQTYAVKGKTKKIYVCIACYDGGKGFTDRDKEYRLQIVKGSLYGLMKNNISLTIKEKMEIMDLLCAVELYEIEK